MYAFGADVTHDCPQRRGATFALYTGAVAVGNTLGPLVSGLLLEEFGFRPPLMLLTGAALAILFLLAPVRESLDPGDVPPGRLDPWRRHNTLAVFYRFLVTHSRGLPPSPPRVSEDKGDRQAKALVGSPSLLPLAAVFCLCFSDLVGQGTIFLYYARRVFHWRPAALG